MDVDHLSWQIKFLNLIENASKAFSLENFTLKKTDVGINHVAVQPPSLPTLIAKLQFIDFHKNIPLLFINGSAFRRLGVNYGLMTSSIISAPLLGAKKNEIDFAIEMNETSAPKPISICAQRCAIRLHRKFVQ